jgi:REP element-mobilizing transposase RayT
MARKPRIELEGALYHVITRGNQKQRIFKAIGDYTKYLEILADYKDRYRYFLYAYALMNNHVHLLIETQEVPLSKLLQGIDQRYTMYFNWKYRRVICFKEDIKPFFAIKTSICFPLSSISI